MPPVPKQTQTRKRPAPIISRFSRWIRLYEEVLDDIKAQSLPSDLFRTWINLLLVASANSGKLPNHSAIAFRLRLSAHDVKRDLDELISLGLIDILPDGNLTPHNWDQRQFKSDSETSAERTRKWRERKAAEAEQRHGDVSVTSQRHFDSDSDSARRVTNFTKRTSLPETPSDPVDDALGAYDPPHDGGPADDDDEVPL